MTAIKIQPLWKKRLQGLLAAHIVFLLTALLGGIFFAFKVPIGFTEDEPVHVFRAYAVMHANLISDPVTPYTFNGETVTLYGGMVPRSVTALEQYTGGGIRHDVFCLNAENRCSKLSPEKQQEVTRLSNAPLDPSNKRAIDMWGASYYFFLPYVPSAAGIAIGQLIGTSAGGLIIAARLASLLAFIAVTFWALYLLRHSRTRWILFSAALLPSSIVLAVSPGVDMMLNASAFLLFALIVRAMQDGKKLSPYLRALMFALAFALPLYKLPYAILSLAVLLLPIYRKGMFGIAWRIAIVLAIFVPALWWNALTADMAHTQAVLTNAQGISPDFGGQIKYILLHPFAFIEIFIKSALTVDWFNQIGLLTQQRVQLPASLTSVSLGLIGIAGIVAALDFTKYKERWRTLAIFLGIGLLAFVGVVSAMYISYSAVGAPIIDGVQGRYLIPMLPFLALGAGLLLRVRLQVNKRAGALFAAAHVLLLFLACTWYYHKVFIWV